MTIPTYLAGSDLPDLAITWLDSSGNVIDLSSGHTFTLKIGVPGETALVTKTTGITGAATAPNITVAWATSGELNTLTPGVYDADLTATRTSGTKERKMRFALRVDAAIT